MSLLYGIPQGSVLELLLFILYTTPLSQIITILRIFKITFMRMTPTTSLPRSIHPITPIKLKSLQEF